MAEQENDKKKIGYTWYPRDWWSSTTFFNCDDLAIRGVMREVFDLMHLNGGYWIADRKYLCKLVRVQLPDDFWSELRSYFMVTTDDKGVESWYHNGVTDRHVSARKLKASRENGKLGGRPPKTQETQEITQENNPAETYKPTLLKEDKDNRIELKVNVNEPLVSSISSSESNSQPLALEGPRLELLDFEERHGTFNPANRKKALKMWKKLTDQETRRAVIDWQNYIDLEKGFGRLKDVRFSKFLDGKWWNFYVEFKKGPYGETE